MRRPLVAAVLVLGVACQPADDPLDEPAAESSDVPTSITALREAAAPTVDEWDADAVLTEVHTQVGENELTSARLTYTAPDVSTLLHVEVTPDGIESGSTTLETLGLAAVSEAGLEEVPELDEAGEPLEVVEAVQSELDDCGHAEPQQVHYVSGVPEGWDGETWRADPAWSVQVLGDEGGVVLEDPGDPEAGTACVDIPQS